MASWIDLRKQLVVGFRRGAVAALMAGNSAFASAPRWVQRFQEMGSPARYQMGEKVKDDWQRASRESAPAPPKRQAAESQTPPHDRLEIGTELRLFPDARRGLGHPPPFMDGPPLAPQPS
jgi:hypothetical protein